MDLSDWRERIDTVDQIVVDLLNRRLRYAEKIGRIKRDRGQQIFDSEREKAVLEGIVDYNQGPLRTETLTAIFKHIVQEARELEEKQGEANLL